LKKFAKQPQVKPHEKTTQHTQVHKTWQEAI